MSNSYTVRDCIELYKILEGKDSSIAIDFYEGIQCMIVKPYTEKRTPPEAVDNFLLEFLNRERYRIRFPLSTKSEIYNLIFRDDITEMPLKLVNKGFSSILARWRVTIGK